jgi:hypothetical protein
MGVPVMELFLVTSKDQTKRGYDKGILAARKRAKEFGKDSSIKPIKVTLTKDGVLDALNAVPFKARGYAATGVRDGVIYTQGLGALGVGSMPDDVDLSPRALRPADWRKHIDMTPGRNEAAVYPKTGLYNPKMFPEDYQHLRDKHPLYVMGWNKVRASRAGMKVRAT